MDFPLEPGPYQHEEFDAINDPMGQAFDSFNELTEASIGVSGF